MRAASEAAARVETAMDEDTAAMVELVSQLGQETAEVLQGMKRADLRNRIELGDSANVRSHRTNGARRGLEG